MEKNNNSYYLNNIENKIKKLELRKKEYEAKLVQQNKLLQLNNVSIEKLKFKKDILQDQYSTLIRLLQEQGIIFEVNFGEYKPQQWENLFIVKSSRGYEIQTKTGRGLIMLDENFSNIIQDINKKDSYSLIVIRVTGKTTLIQLRFN